MSSFVMKKQIVKYNWLFDIYQYVEEKSEQNKIYLLLSQIIQN